MLKLLLNLVFNFCTFLFLTVNSLIAYPILSVNFMSMKTNVIFFPVSFLFKGLVESIKMAPVENSTGAIAF